jgi:acyl-CoA synthetase (AMP-forming)/AMP-acid ligase II
MDGRQAAPLIQEAVTTPDDVALRDSRTTLTWAEVADLVDRVVTRLRAHVGPGDRIAVFAENSVETVIAHLAGLIAGVATVPVNFHLTAREVADLLVDSRGRVILVGPETAEIGVDAAALAGDRDVLGWRTTDRPGVADWTAVAADRTLLHDIQQGRPYPNILYTSGTTGSPKATELPPTMFAGGATVAEHLSRLRTQATMASGASTVPGTHLVVGPLYHTGPLCAYRLLAGGTSVVVLGRFDAEQTLAAIDRYSVASTSLVPTHFRRLLALPVTTRKRYNVSSVKHVWTTGAACPPALKQAMIDWWGPVISEAYGATEVGTVTSISAEEWLGHRSSVGRCIPPFDAVIVDENGDEVPPNVIGRIYFRDATGRGVVYLNDPQKTAAAHLAPGVFTLGEIGYVDADGYVYITDRSTDMVVSGGVNIYPAEAERTLSEHPAVQDVAVIGVPDPDMGEALRGLVVLNPGYPTDEAELVEFCRERLAHYKCPPHIEFRSTLSRTEVGKLDKHLLRAPYWPSPRTIG